MPKDNSHACDCGLPTCPLCVEAAWERLEKALKARGPAPPTEAQVAQAADLRARRHKKLKKREPLLTKLVARARADKRLRKVQLRWVNDELERAGFDPIGSSTFYALLAKAKGEL